MLQIEIITVKSFKIKTGLTTSYIGQQLWQQTKNVLILLSSLKNRKRPIISFLEYAYSNSYDSINHWQINFF